MKSLIFNQVLKILFKSWFKIQYQISNVKLKLFKLITTSNHKNKTKTTNCKKIIGYIQYDKFQLIQSNCLTEDYIFLSLFPFSFCHYLIEYIVTYNNKNIPFISYLYTTTTHTFINSSLHRSHLHLYSYGVKAHIIMKNSNFKY